MMHTSQNDDQRRQSGATGRAFRRVGATVAVTCAITGSLAAFGAASASAATPAPTATNARTALPTITATVKPTAPVSPAATSRPTTSVPVRTTPPKSTPPKSTPPKTIYSQADIRAFLRSAYSDDAVNLAVVWGTPDLVTAKGKAGAKLRAGKALPFTPAKATTQPWTAEQQEDAFFLSGYDYAEAFEVAAAWGLPDVGTAKTKIGAALLAHTAVPTAPKTYTPAQDVNAFHLAGYDDADGKALAKLWHTGSVRAAEVRGGAELLAGRTLPKLP